MSANPNSDPKTSAPPAPSTQTTTPSPSSPTREEFLALQQQLVDTNKRLTDTTAELKRQQSAADRLKARQQAVEPPAAVLPQAPLRAGAQNDPMIQKLREAQQIAEEATRETMLLRELQARGLTETDVDGIEFNTPTELRLALDIIQMKRDQEALRKSTQSGGGQQQAAASAAAAAQSQVVIDAGGPTGGEGSKGGSSADYTQLDQVYSQLRSAKKGQDAFIQMIETIHQDDRKVVRAPRT